MTDANVLISAIVFRSSKMSAVLLKVIAEHELCIATYTIEEVKRIINEKFGDVEVDISEFFEDFPYTLIETPFDSDSPLVNIRDASDYPVIYTAITGQVDVLLTGDKDFFDLKIDRPEIMQPLDFLDRYK